jgi:hypothetical protein
MSAGFGFLVEGTHRWPKLLPSNWRYKYCRMR